MHLKICLMNYFVKAMNKGKAAFTYIRELIPF